MNTTIWIPDYRRGVYPDAMFFDGALQFNGDREGEVLNQLLIVEGLSPSTEEYDRTDKFRMYRSIPSFCEYLYNSPKQNFCGTLY